MASRRCSVETNSSPRDCASFWACCKTRPSRPEAESCTLPLTFGWRWSSVASAVESCAGWMPSAVSTLGTMPPAWSTSADARCSTSSCAWPSSRAFCCAATSASCDFSVSLFGSITQQPQSGAARLLEEVAPDVLPAARRGDLARKLALFFVELRRHDDLDGAVEIPVAAARAGHPLAGETNSAPVLRFRRDAKGDPTLERRHSNFSAQHRFMHRDREVDAEVVAIAREERMRLHPNAEVRVPGRTSAHAGIPLPRKADPLPILHPRRDLHGESPGRPAVVS